MTAAIDHLVVAAATLEQGVAWSLETLGLEPDAGGRHPLMGTHNRLLKIASNAFADAYLEIIAIDPGAVAPGRRRWFGLDEPALQARLAAGPCLVHCVARTRTLASDRLALTAIGLDPGEPVAASRQTPEGLLAWQITVPADGRPLCAGALPTLIEWQGRHPARALPERDLKLTRLVLSGLPPAAAEVLGLPGVEFAAGPGPCAIHVTLQTPRGEVTLQTRHQD